jgi:hypothetical protein
LEKAYAEWLDVKEKKGSDPKIAPRLEAATRGLNAANAAYQAAYVTPRPTPSPAEERNPPPGRTDEVPRGDGSEEQAPQAARPQASGSGAAQGAVVTGPLSPPDPLQSLSVAQDCRALLERTTSLLAGNCQAGWSEAAKSLSDLHKGLQWLDQDFRELPKPDSEGEWRQQLENRVPKWADENITVLRRLDELLSGKNEKGEDLTGPTDQSLLQELGRVRNQLLQFISRYGGWEEYPVKVGDPVANHLGNLDPVGVRGRTSGPAIVRAILHPGYRRKRDGYPKKARVLLSS